MPRLLFALLAARAAADIPGLFDALDEADALLAPDHAFVGLAPLRELDCEDNW